MIAGDLQGDLDRLRGLFFVEMEACMPVTVALIRSRDAAGNAIARRRGP